MIYNIVDKLLGMIISLNSNRTNSHNSFSRQIHFIKILDIFPQTHTSCVVNGYSCNSLSSMMWFAVLLFEHMLKAVIESHRFWGPLYD